MTPPAAVSPQAELAQGYGSAMRRAVQAKIGLAQLQRRDGGSGAGLPDDIRATNDRLDTQLRDTVLAMRARDTGSAGRSLHALEDTLTESLGFGRHGGGGCPAMRRDEACVLRSHFPTFPLAHCCFVLTRLSLLATRNDDF